MEGSSEDWHSRRYNSRLTTPISRTVKFCWENVGRKNDRQSHMVTQSKTGHSSRSDDAMECLILLSGIAAFFFFVTLLREVEWGLLG